MLTYFNNIYMTGKWIKLFVNSSQIEIQKLLSKFCQWKFIMDQKTWWNWKIEKLKTEVENMPNFGHYVPLQQNYRDNIIVQNSDNRRTWTAFRGLMSLSISRFSNCLNSNILRLVSGLPAAELNCRNGLLALDLWTVGIHT